jgi:large subunit ribosomal protein L15
VAIGSFEGGQMPIHMRLPKRGFHNVSSKRFQVVNLGRLQQAVDAGKLDAKKTVDAAALQAAGVIRRPWDGVRILAKGALKSKLTLDVVGASSAAITAIEAAGGSIKVLPPKARTEKKGRTKASRAKAKAEAGARGAAAPSEPPKE